MEDTDQVKPEYSNGAGCLMRVYWMFAGNAFLLIVFAFLIDRNPKFPSLLDAVCLFAASSVVVVRYIDIRYCKGETGEGQPATMAHWRKYSLLIGLGSGGVWLAVRLLAPLFAK